MGSYLYGGFNEGNSGPAVYINESFNSGVIPSGWTTGGAATITADPSSLKFAGTSTNPAWAAKLGTVDSNNGDNVVEAKFTPASVSVGSGSQTCGLFLRATGNPVGTTLPLNAILFKLKMLSGATACEIGSTDGSGTYTTAQTNNVSVTYAAGAQYRTVFSIQEALDTAVYVVSLYVQRMSDGAWLLPSGSFTSAGDVQTAFMSITTAYSNINAGGGAGPGPQAYVTAWGSGTKAGILTFMVNTEVFNVDDFIWGDMPFLTGNIPANPGAPTNEVELLPAATTASDAGQVGHTGANINAGDSDFASYYIGANTFAGNYGQYALLDAGSGKAVAPSAVRWSPGYTSFSTMGGIGMCMVGAVVEGANVSTGPWTPLGVTPTNQFPFQRLLSLLRLNPILTYRYIRLRSATMPCAINQVRVECAVASMVGSPNCRPSRPTITPAGGPQTNGSTFTATSNTSTVAGQPTALYYTAGTRTNPPADPTNASTLYTGPTAIPANSPDETIIKMVAYNTGCSTPTSAVTTAHFKVPIIAKSFKGLVKGFAQIQDNVLYHITGHYSISCWLFAPAKQTNFNPVLSKEAAGSNGVYLGINQLGTNGNIYFGHSAGTVEADYTIPSAAFYGAWHHILGVYDGANAIIYLDGVAVQTTPGSTNPVSNTVPMNLGSFQGGTPAYLIASFADVALFNTALTAGNAASLANGSVLPAALSPVGLWSMRNISGGVIPDGSGNNNPAYVRGAAGKDWTWNSDGPTQLASEPLSTPTPPISVFDTGTTGTTWYSNGSLAQWPGAWYDTNGNRMSFNNCDVSWDPDSNLYWLIGGNMSDADMFANPLVFYRGHNFYSSPDLLSWTFQGQLIPNVPIASAASLTRNLIGRPHVLRNPSPIDPKKKYVLVGGIGANDGATGQAGFWTAPAMAGPWKLTGFAKPNTRNVGDCNVFADDDGKRYFIFKLAGGDLNFAVQLDPATDWTTFTGSNTQLQPNDGTFAAYEAPCMVKQGGNYFLITTSATPYGQGITTVVYQSATTLSGLASVDGTVIWASTPPLNSAAYNVQSGHIFAINGLSPTAYMFVFDLQDAGDTTVPIDMINAESAWLPAPTATNGNALNAFPSAGILKLPFPLASDLSNL